MKVPINQKFIENTRVQRFLAANLFLLIEEKNQGFMLLDIKKGFVFQLTVKYSKILDISMQKIQSIDFGDKKSANENL